MGDVLTREFSVPAVSRKETRKRRVLVVDDNPVIIESLSVCFLAAGFAVDSAADGVEALAHIHESRPDMVILDVRMPRMDGWEVLRSVREDPRMGDLPIIMLTELGGEQAVVRGISGGADDYVEKPFHAMELLARASRIMDVRESLRSSGCGDHPMDKVPVGRGERVGFVPTDEIVYIEAAGKYSYLHTFNSKLLGDYTLKELEAGLADPERFFRVHRSFLISLDKVVNVIKEAPDRFVVVMDDESGSRIYVSQRRIKAFKEAIHLSPRARAVRR
jgi:CheY-like chemotaxis protein